MSSHYYRLRDHKVIVVNTREVHDSHNFNDIASVSDTSSSVVTVADETLANDNVNCFWLVTK